MVVSPRWILAALTIVVAGAAFCVWAALCLTFRLGGWQLLYHPAAAIQHTPADAGLAFENIDFATTEAGQPQLHGWWIPGPAGTHITAIYLHGADGNIGDAVPALTSLHNAQMNLLVFDYRGYGESRFEHPTEARWREDAEWAIRYLTDTRHVPARSIVLAGSELGANLALEVAAAHPELAGVVIEHPVGSPTDTVFDDPRAHLVPARWLFPDRWDLTGAVTNLRVPSLWFSEPGAKIDLINQAYGRVTSRKTRVWLTDGPDRSKTYADAVARWLDDLNPHAS